MPGRGLRTHDGPGNGGDLRMGLPALALSSAPWPAPARGSLSPALQSSPGAGGHCHGDHVHTEGLRPPGLITGGGRWHHCHSASAPVCSPRASVSTGRFQNTLCDTLGQPPGPSRHPDPHFPLIKELPSPALEGDGLSRPQFPTAERRKLLSNSSRGTKEHLMCAGEAAPSFRDKLSRMSNNWGFARDKAHRIKAL